MLDWDYDAPTRSVRLGTATIRLSDTESRAFEYLMARRGTVVSREELEREVWGFAPGTKSETVPVTLRKVRNKLAAKGVSVVVSVRSLGWRLIASFRRPRTDLPTFGTPLFPREDEVRGIEALFEDGWRVVSVVGPGGSGKTRLAVAAARRCDASVFYVELGHASTEDEVRLALVTATGMSDGGVPALAKALGSSDALFVLDEVELARDAVVDIVRALPLQRFLITGRRELGIPEEAAHAVAPLEGVAGREFVRLRMRAARWRHDPSDEVVDALLARLDGLPLAIEVVAGHPTAPEVLLEALRAGSLPQGSGAKLLHEALESSYLQLDPEMRRMLQCLSLREGALPGPALSAWLGSEAEALVEELARRSLVSHEGAGWRVLATMRSFVRTQEADWVGLQASFDTWLVGHFAWAADAVWSDPRTVLDGIAPLVDDGLGALRRLEVAAITPVLWMLYMVSLFRGPYPLYLSALTVVTRRAPELPVVRMLGAVSGDSQDPVSLVDALGEADPRDQVRVLIMLTFAWLPRSFDLEGWMPAAPTCELDRLHLARIALGSDAEGLVQTRELLDELAGMPLLKLMTRFSLARTLHLLGQTPECLREWEDLIADLGVAQMNGPRVFAMQNMADTLVEVDRVRAAMAYLHAGSTAIEHGFADSWVVGRCGVWLCLLGRDAEALPLLEQGAKGYHLGPRLACSGLVAALEARPFDAENLDAVTGALSDGTDLRALVQAVLSGKPMSSVDTAAARVWARTLAARAG